MLKEEVLRAKQSDKFDKQIAKQNERINSMNKNLNYLVKWHNDLNPYLQKKRAEDSNQNVFLTKYIHYFLHLMLLGVICYISYLFITEIRGLKAEITGLKNQVNVIDTSIHKPKK